jgi:tRNA(fMet)-specific endonuclease VapC
MKFLLDTNVCIDALRGRSEVVHHMATASPDECAISAISLFELECGARKSKSPKAELSKVYRLIDPMLVLAWDQDAAVSAAKIRADLERIGMKIGAYDTLLAGHAVSLGLTFVTSNLCEFERIENLSLENWRTR